MKLGIIAMVNQTKKMESSVPLLHDQILNANF